MFLLDSMVLEVWHFLKITAPAVICNWYLANVSWEKQYSISSGIKLSLKINSCNVLISIDPGDKKFSKLIILVFSGSECYQQEP